MSGFRLLCLAWVLSVSSSPAAAAIHAQVSDALRSPAQPEKVIVDTDIGYDIDDAFAVAVALQSPEFDVRGFSTASGDTLARARILDRMLGLIGRAHLPVAVGSPTTLPPPTPGIGRQTRFGANGAFARATHPAAVNFLSDEIRKFPHQTTVIAIGPLTNLAALLDKDPSAFHQLKRIVAMGGQLQPVDMGGWGTGATTSPEYNIVGDIAAAQKVFNSGVPIYLIPLDSTMSLKLDEVKRDAILSKGTPLSDSLAILYAMWNGVGTPVLYDVMALAYVVEPTLCPMQPLHISVDDTGVTHADSGTPNAFVCLHSDPEAFFRWFMNVFDK
jgi:purine nucleosidase